MRSFVGWTREWPGLEDPHGARDSPVKSLSSVCGSVIGEPALDGFEEENDSLGSSSAVAFKFWGHLVCNRRQLLRRAVEAFRRETSWNC